MSPSRVLQALAGAAVLLVATAPATAWGGVAAPRLELKPARVAKELRPGESTTVTLELANRTARALRLRFLAIDLQAGDEDSFAAPATGPVERPASGWLRFPVSARTLGPGERAQVEVLVDVPPDAAPGAYAVAMVASQAYGGIGANDADEIGSRVAVNANLGSTLVLVVTGDARASLRIIDASGPRLVWRAASPTFTATVENDGETLLKLESAVELSSFAAFARRTLKSREVPTLPGGRRTLRMAWTDRPWIGWFTPRLVVVGGEGSGLRVERSLPTVFVLPPWWVLLALALALVLPLRSRARRRRQRARHRQRARARALDDEQDLLSP